MSLAQARRNPPFVPWQNYFFRAAATAFCNSASSTAPDSIWSPIT